MIVFVGRQEKGFFAEESGETVEYVQPTLYIEEQANDILAYKESVQTVIYDIEQYASEPEEIVKWVNKIQDALRVRTIIFAAGYGVQSNVIQQLWKSGIKNFIFSVYLGDQKEDLENCLSGYYENFGYEEKRGISFDVEETQSEEAEKSARTICIGIAGCISRMGTTTQALQIIKYLQFMGYSAAYFQMNNHGFVESVKDHYEGVDEDDETGRVTYSNIDMYCKQGKLQEVLNKGYDYIVFDYGVAYENGYNKVSFLEKKLQIFVLGSKPGGEFEKAFDVIKNNFYNQVMYIFNFVAESETKDLKALMDDKADVTFFATEARDPFVFCGDTEMYGSLLSISNSKKVKEPVKKKMFGRRTKK